MKAKTLRNIEHLASTKYKDTKIARKKKQEKKKITSFFLNFPFYLVKVEKKFSIFSLVFPFFITFKYKKKKKSFSLSFSFFLQQILRIKNSFNIPINEKKNIPERIVIIIREYVGFPFIGFMLLFLCPCIGIYIYIYIYISQLSQ